jgi:type IV secretion system protein TrbL
MNDFSAIDGFLTTFITYIDSGFGLISGDVTSLAAILIVIDVTLAVSLVTVIYSPTRRDLC